MNVALEGDGQHKQVIITHNEPTLYSTLWDPYLLVNIMNNLSVHDVFQLSLCTKSMHATVVDGPYNWKMRALRDFRQPYRIISSVENTPEIYLQCYKCWRKRLQTHLYNVEWYSKMIRLLVFIDIVFINEIRSVEDGRLINFYETWIVFIGLPVITVLFTVLMMLRLNLVIRTKFVYLYSVLYAYFILIIPFLCLPGLYIYANTKKKISLMWFLSNFNRNLIFTMIKSDYVTRSQKEAPTTVKFISNNEVVFTNNTHYYLLLLQIGIVYFGVFANVIVFNFYQSLNNMPEYVFVIIEWIFTVFYGVIMHYKMRSTGIKKDEDKWECAYFYSFVFQLSLVSAHILFGFPSLYWAVFPTMLIIGFVCFVLCVLFVGLLRISVNGIAFKRLVTGTAVIASFFLLMFTIHIVDKFGRFKKISSVLLCIEFIIPMLCMLLPISLHIRRTERTRPPILRVDNYEIVHNREYLRSLTETEFDIHSRLRRLFQTEGRLLRFIICSQLFKSFIQTPSITENAHFPEIMELIEELRHNRNPDIIHYIHVLRNTHITFSPLLECIINEIMDNEDDVLIGDGDVEMGFTIDEDRRVFEMNDGTNRGLPALNPMIHEWLQGDRGSQGDITQQISLDTQLEGVLFSLLEEASFEDHFTRM